MVTLRIVPGSGQTHPLIEARMEMDDRLMTVKELAAYLNLNERTVLKLAAEGPLPAVKVGNQWRVLKSTIHTRLVDPKLRLSRPHVRPPRTERARRLLAPPPGCLCPPPHPPPLPGHPPTPP